MESIANIEIDGIEYDQAVELHRTVVKAEYPDQSNQPAISDLNFTLVNDAARKVIDIVQNDPLGVFHAKPSSIRVSSNGESFETFKGMLDFTKDYRTIEENQASVTLVPFDGQNQFNERAAAVTYVEMEDSNFFQNSDYFTVPWLFEKNEEFIELAIVGVMTYIMAREAADAIRRLANNVTDIAATAAGGITGSIASIAEAVAKTLVEAAFAALMLNAVIKMILDLLERFISPVRYYRAMKLETLLKKGCERLGYKFSSSVSELANLVYLPSKTNSNGSRSRSVLNQGNLPQTSGVPRPTDRIYSILDAFTFAENLFRAKRSVRGDTVFLEPLNNDAFWLNQSTFQIGDLRGAQAVKDINVQFNTDDMRGRRLYRYQTDVNDDWTLDNYKGTTYEVNTELVTVQDEKLNRISGFAETNFGAALGTRKDELSGLEKALKTLAQAVDGVVNTFGGNSTYAQRIQNRVGMLKMSARNVNVSKLLYYTGNTIPVNHRDLMGAKTFYEKYHTVDSFVQNGGANQWVIKPDLKVPFNFEKFKEVMNSSYFNTVDGYLAKIIAWNWEVYNDFATMAIRIRYNYAKNLQERFIELT